MQECLLLVELLLLFGDVSRDNVCELVRSFDDRGQVSHDSAWLGLTFLGELPAELHLHNVLRLFSLARQACSFLLLLVISTFILLAIHWLKHRRRLIRVKAANVELDIVNLYALFLVGHLVDDVVAALELSPFFSWGLLIFGVHPFQERLVEVYLVVQGFKDVKQPE